MPRLPESLTDDEIEDIERLTLRWVFQAVSDFGFQAYEIFRDSPDEVKDIAEDVTREILDRLSGYNIPQRLLGNVDYRRARYIVLPNELVRQALFADSKAEQSASSATMQMSQVSLRVRQTRADDAINIAGKLPQTLDLGGESFLSTVILLHYNYRGNEAHHLDKVTLCAVPNGQLQNIYNPNEQDTIWLAGRNAPTRGEDFRVRLSFNKLKAKRSWRVQQLFYFPNTQSGGGIVQGAWEE